MYFQSISQIFKTLQDTIQAIKKGLQELGDDLRRLVSFFYFYSNFNEVKNV